MNRILIVLVIGLYAAWGATPGLAQGARINDFERYKTSDETITMSEYNLLMNRLIGTYEGIGWVNALNDQEGKPQIFCPPADFTITVDYLRGMLDEEIRAHNFSSKPYPDDMPMDAIVMFAASSRFPCRN